MACAAKRRRSTLHHLTEITCGGIVLAPAASSVQLIKNDSDHIGIGGSIGGRVASDDLTEMLLLLLLLWFAFLLIIVVERRKDE